MDTVKMGVEQRHSAPASAHSLKQAGPMQESTIQRSDARIFIQQQPPIEYDKIRQVSPAAKNFP
jgi:hypothetical protein